MNTENQTIKTEVTTEDLATNFAFSINAEETPELPEIPVTLDLGQGAEEEGELETKEITPETPKEEVSLEPKADNFYLNLLKKNIEKGVWEDVLIEEEENSFKLSEIEDLTEEDYFEFLAEQEKLKAEDLKEKYVSVDNLPENKKIILDIVRNGGDLQEIFKTADALEEPFSESQGWDLDNEQHQYSIVYQQYLRQGLDEKKAKLLADEDAKDVTLDSKAKEIVDAYKAAYTENLKKINEDLIKEAQEEEKRVKEYRSTLTKKYKEETLPEATYKKLVDLATKKGENGFAVDDIYEQIMKDPEQAADLIFFMVEKQKFLERASQNKVNKSQVENFKTIKRIPKDRQKQAVDEKETSNSTFVFSVAQE
jgi:hypothetical protein